MACSLETIIRIESMNTWMGQMLDFDEFISEPLNEQTLLKSCTQPAIKNKFKFRRLCLSRRDESNDAGLSSVLICYS